MSKRIAAFGEVMMRLQTPGYERLSQAEELRYSFSGSGVNVLSALARYGHSVKLATRLPDNPLGDAAFASLRKLGIGTEFVSRGGAYVGMYFLENGFGPRPSRVTYTNRLESSFNTAPDDAFDFGAIAAHADAFHYCGIALAMNDAVRNRMYAFAEAVRAAGGIAAFDCNYRESLWGEDGYAKAKPHYERMLALSDIAFLNEKDAMLTLGMPYEGHTRQERLEELIPLVAERFGLSAVAGTHREAYGNGNHSLRGFLYRAGKFVYSPQRDFPVLDRVGAGDAYASGILHGLLEDWPDERTVTFAAAAGVLAHADVGDSPLSTVRDVERAMSGASRDIER